jgi:ribosome maturation factor RimP
MAETLTEQVKEIALPVTGELGLELVEVQYRREQNGWVLRLIIDREGGIGLDECATVSREVSQLLDIEDFIEQAYNLEVSSPGLNRPLKTLAEFERFAGRKAKVKTKEPIEGERVFIGTIAEVKGESVIVDTESGKVTIQFPQIAGARLEVDF